MKKYRIVLAVLLLLAVCAVGYGCAGKTAHKEGYRYVIGVSIANDIEPWLKNMVTEIDSQLAKEYPDTNVIYKEATDDPDRQIADVEALTESGIDLLIIVPQSSTALSDEISKIHQQIPVIVAGVEPGTSDYTSFINFSDYDMGKMIGDYILAQKYRAGDKVFVLEGPEKSQISMMRKDGFADTIPEADITYANGEWLRDKAEDRTKDYLILNKRFDIVFAFNDEMAYGAYIAANELRVTNACYIGIDGYAGENGGIALVQNGVLGATVSCSGIGTKTLDVAMDVLKGQKVDRNYQIEAKLITGKELQ